MKLLEKELERTKSPSHELKEVKLLLDKCHQDDINMLKQLSRNSEINLLERNRGNRLELERLDKAWNGNVYNNEEIKNLCIKYRLRFLPSMYYIGKFDVNTTAALRKFSEENKVSLDEYTLKNKFFILAPPELFSLEETKYIRKRELDPVLFYHIGNGSYKKVHAWGADFTIFRRLIGYKWKSARNEMVFNTTILFCIISIMFSMFFPYIMYSASIAMIFVVLIVSIGIATNIGHTDGLEQIDQFFTPYNWDNTKKLI